MTTANKITIFRVVLIPVFLVLMYLRFPGHMYWAFGVVSRKADGLIFAYLIRKGIRCLLLSVKLTAENMKRNIKI